jgi:pSer/pThr/pTyr-binding forkhead associated (FHA) protein
MPYVQLDGLQYPLEPGDTAVGAGPEAGVKLRGTSAEGIFAMLEMADDGSVIVRRVGSVSLKVNGLELADQPSPLIHGDKLEILGHELYFGDDRRAGNTMYVPSVQLPEGGTPRAAGSRTAATGGRLVSLVDGREYPVPDEGLVLGRDPTCDVVVPSTEVSRRHATIAPSAGGYLLSDLSTNGMLVNSTRVMESRLLGKGDVIRVAEEEFRFYADNAPPPRPLLATLEVVGTTALSGQRFEIRTALVHLGRGDHNDLVLADESVSDSHATIQKRESEGWYVVDMESTNGTYVAGRRIAGISRLEDTCDLRFGGVKMVFRAAEPRVAGAKDTRVIAPIAGPRRPALTPKHIPAERAVVRAAAPATPHARGIPAIVWILLSALLAIVVFIFLTSR